jgi:CheY-like chemotaxis protein
MPGSRKLQHAPARIPARKRKVRASRSAAQNQGLVLASFAHEVRTPLNAVLAFAELLASSDIPQRERGWALAIKTTTEHIAALSTLIVEGVRAEVGAPGRADERFEPAALAHVLGESLAARAAVRGLTAEVRIANDLPHAVLGDAIGLRAAAENLIDNAAKLTNSGKTIRLAIAAKRHADEIALEIAVSDEGPGLSPAQLRGLFKPFATGLHGGAGLGLAFARSVARASGGDITVESTPERGTTFRLTAVVTPAADAEQLPSVARPGRPGKLRILCVEDNSFGRVVMRTLAAALGHEIDFCETGVAAIKAAAGARHDLVLMDVVLPDIDGFEATQRIRQLKGAGGATPIIGLSGYGRKEDRARAIAAGMDGYLIKPISAVALARALEEAMSSERAA